MAAERYYEGLASARRMSVEWLETGRVLSYDIWRKMFKGHRFIIAKAFERIRQATSPRKSKIDLEASEVSTLSFEQYAQKRNSPPSYQPAETKAA